MKSDIMGTAGSERGAQTRARGHVKEVPLFSPPSSSPQPCLVNRYFVELCWKLCEEFKHRKD